MSTKREDDPPEPDDYDSLDALAGEYVLGTLDAANRRAVEGRLISDASLQTAVDAWQARLHPLTSLAPMVEPSSRLWSRIEQAITPRAAAVRARPPPAPTIWQSWWQSLALWRGLAAAGIAATFALAFLPALRTAFGDPDGGAAQYVVVLVAPGGQAPGWVVHANTPQDLRLTPVNQTNAPPDKALQFWTKADSWNAPVSLGLVKPGETLRVRIDRLPALQPNQLFEITLEPPSGSPTGRPTGPIQYIGRAVKISS